MEDHDLCNYMKDILCLTCMTVQPPPSVTVSQTTVIPLDNLTAVLDDVIDTSPHVAGGWGVGIVDIEQRHLERQSLWEVVIIDME